MMFAARRLRQFSTRAAAPRQEYPTSFVSHLKTQKLNVFNIGVAFLTLSLSSQLVNYKQKLERASLEAAQLTARVHVLEQLVVELGGVVPAADDVAAAAAADALKAEHDKVQRERDEEAKMLATMAGAASSTEEDAAKPKAKGMLI